MVPHKYQRVSESGSDVLPSHTLMPPNTERFFNLHHLAHLLIFGSGIFLGYLFNSWISASVPSSKHLVPSPADVAVDGKPLILKPHHQEYKDHHQNPYTGFPTPQKDAAWMELMDGYSIRVPKSHVDAVDLESIPLNDGSGDVWVSMNIYHHLHCLDSIRHQVAGVGCKTPDDIPHEEYFPPHIDHCIETLRRRLMCQPDLGIRAVAWAPDIRADAVKANNTVNAECVDWSAVQDWTKKHTFSPEEKLITQPNGKIYNGPWTPPPRCGV